MSGRRLKSAARQPVVRKGAAPVLGIIAIDSATSLFPGSTCNAANYGVPIEFCLAEGVTGNRCLAGDPAITEVLIEAARNLESRGCSLIGSNCGFLGRYQLKVANAVRPPVFLSSLPVLPMLEVVLKESAKMGVLTYSAASLTRDLLESAGWHGPENRVVVAGIDHTKSWAVLNAPHAMLDPVAMQSDLLHAVTSLLSADSAISALLFECTTMSAFAPHISRHLRVPIFDYTALLKTMIATLRVSPYRGVIAPPADAGLRIAECISPKTGK